MKKLLLPAFAALACVAAANAEEVTLDFTKNQYGQTIGSNNENKDFYMVDGESFTDGVITITAVISPDSKTGPRFFKADNGDITFRVTNKNGIKISTSEGEITSIVLTGKSLNYFSADGYNTTSHSFEGSEAVVELTNTGSGSSTGTIQIQTMVITYGAADTRKAADLAFSAEKVEAALGSKFTAPTLAKATNAAVTYSSDKETVATVDAATGVVTLVGEGTARITAKAEANSEYRSGSASYLLTVTSAPVAGAIFTSKMGEGFSFENPEDIAVWSLDSKYGLKASAYVNNKPNAAVAVAYASVDLTNQTKATLTFSQALNQFKNGNEMIDVDALFDYCQIVVREEGATSWTEVCEPTSPKEFSWIYFENAPVDLTAYCGKKIQFGFKYTSTTSVAGTWDIKNIHIIGDGSDSIREINAAATSGAIYDLQGRRVLAPAHGLYIVNGKVVRL